MGALLHDEHLVARRVGFGRRGQTRGQVHLERGILPALHSGSPHAAAVTDVDVLNSLEPEGSTDGNVR